LLEAEAVALLFCELDDFSVTKRQRQYSYLFTQTVLLFIDVYLLKSVYMLSFVRNAGTCM